MSAAAAKRAARRKAAQAVIDARYPLSPGWPGDDPAEQERIRRENADYDAWISCRICGKQGVIFAQDFGTWPPATLPVAETAAGPS
jgi:hypothetical protein